MYALRRVHFVYINVFFLFITTVHASISTVTVAVLHPVAVSYDGGPIFGALIAEDDPVIAVIFPCALLYHAVIAQRQVADHIVEVGGIKILAPGVEHDQTLAADRLHRRAGDPIVVVASGSDLGQEVLVAAVQVARAGDSAGPAAACVLPHGIAAVVPQRRAVIRNPQRVPAQRGGIQVAVDIVCVAVPPGVPFALVENVHGVLHQTCQLGTAQAGKARVLDVHKDRVFQLQAVHDVQERRQLVGNGGAGAGVGIVVGPYPQTRGLGPVDVLQKVRVHVQAAAVGGTDADNGKLLARRRHPAPVDIALIARHVNAVLEKRHKKPPFAV